MKSDKNEIKVNENADMTAAQPEKQPKNTVDKRNKSLRLISVTSVVLFIAIVLIFNIVFGSLLGNKLRWDWSQTDLFSVSDITEKLLTDMDKDVKILGLYTKGTVPDYIDFEILLDKYQTLSGGKLTVQYIDPIKTPSIIAQVDPDDMLKPQTNDFVVWCEETDKAKVIGIYDLYKVGLNPTTNQQEVQGIMAEQSFSGAIIYTMSLNTPVVYMVKGHGEANYNENYTSMIDLIQNNNFLVKDLDMLVEADIPEDAELLIILNPTSDITVKDKVTLDRYLRKGRSLLIMTEFNNTKYTNLNTLLAEYNIEISNDRVREGEKERRYQDEPYIFITDIAPGTILESGSAESTLIMNGREIVEINNTKEWLKVEPFIVTGSQAVVEVGGDETKTGQPGVTSLGIATLHSGFIDSTTVVDPTKVLVVGASSYIDDSIIQAFGTSIYNIYAFYAGLGWLVDIDNQDLLITPKDLPSYNLTSGSSTGYWIATIICIILIPLALFITALVVYRRRKNM